MEVYTHRGIGFGPENTHTAFSRAALFGVHIETDVRSTSDRRLVTIHDDRLNRTTTGRGLLRNKTYHDLKLISANGQLKNTSQEEIPLLEDVLTSYGSQVKFDLDIKEFIGTEVLEMVTGNQLLEQTIFTSDIFEVSQNIKKRNSNAVVGFITDKNALQLLPMLKKNGIDYVCPAMSITTPELIERSHDKGIAVLPWFTGKQRLWTPAMSKAVDVAVKYETMGIIVNHTHETFQRIQAGSSTQVFPQKAA